MGRADGKKIKGMGGFDRMLALVVGKTRVESTNLFTMDIITKTMDEFIASRKKDGVEYSYRDIVIAALVRTFYLRPRLNRFVVAGNFYQRNFIDVAMTVHKDLRSGGEEAAIKCRFTGKETIQEIKASLDKEIYDAVMNNNQTDKFTSAINWLPTWVFRWIVRGMRVLDRYGLLTDKFMFKVSPFHSSIFFADLKSIHLDRIYHHLYNFGNCGFFCAMGKDKMKALVDERSGEIKPTKVVELGVSEDERFIDGLYYTGMIKVIHRLLDNLELLERAPEDDEVKKCPTPKEIKKQKKQKRKAARIAAKSSK